MNKTIVFSDIHIHTHKNSLNRLNDCIDCLEWVFKTAVDRNIDKIIFSGDMFQDRQRISVISYQKTFEVFEKYKDKLTVYLLLGNHDLYHLERRDITSVIPLRALPKVKIIDAPSTVCIDGTNVDFLPYTHNPKADIEQYFKNKSSLLFGHVSIDGACLNVLYNTLSEISVEYEGDMVKVGVDVFNEYKRVFLGHFHAAQKLNDKVEYIGSPLQLNFNEVFQKKHIIELDLDTLECEYIENTFSPKHLIIKESEIDQYDIKGNFIQVTCENINAPSVIDIKNKIQDQASTLEFRESKFKKSDHMKVDIEKAKQVLSEGATIEKYVSLFETSLDKNRLIALGKDIMNKTTTS